MAGYWRIEVYDGNTRVFERVIGQGKMTSRQVEATLRTLVAKHGSTDDEVIDSHAKRGTRLYRSLLDVSWSMHGTMAATCGENPHAVATLLDENHQPRQIPVIG